MRIKLRAFAHDAVNDMRERWLRSPSVPLNALLGIIVGTYVLVSLLYMVRNIRTGDGHEYWMMVINLAETRRAYTTPPALEIYESLRTAFPQSDFAPAGDLNRLGLTSPHGGADYFHFWFYSLCAVPFYWLLKYLGLNPGAALLCMHLAVFVYTFFLLKRLFGRLGGWLAVTFLLATPTLYFVNKPQVEYWTILLGLCAVACVFRGWYFAAALHLAIMSTQNPPFALVVPVCFALWYFRTDQRLLTVRQTLAVMAASALVCLHPVYYLWRLGVVTPQLITSGVAPQLFSIISSWIWLFDPNIGLFPNWLPGIALLVIALVVWDKRIRPRENWPTLAFCVYYYAILSVVLTTTGNVNSGGTISVCRYSLWFLGLLLPILLLIVGAVERYHAEGKKGKAAALVMVLLLLVVYNIRQYGPSNREKYDIPTPLSDFILQRWPSLYDPDPDIFVDRYSGMHEVDPAKTGGVVSNIPCTKILFLKDVLAKQNWQFPPKAAGCSITFYPGSVREQVLAAFARKPRVNYVYLTPTAEQMHRRDTITLSSKAAVSLGYDTSNRYCGRDWGLAENWGRWTTGKEATLSFRVEAVEGRKSRLQLRITIRNAFVPLPGMTQRVELEVNGQRCGTARLAHPFPGLAVIACDLPDRLKQVNELKMLIPDAIAPSEIPSLHSPDDRRLGIYITALELAEEQGSAKPADLPARVRSSSAKKTR